MMLALLTLAHGALLSSLSERAGSRTAARELRLRGAAEHALAAALSASPNPSMDSMGLWVARTQPFDTIGGVPTRGIVRRLGPESWLVEGAAGESSGVEATSRRLAWTLDPLVRVMALGGVVTVGADAPVTIAGTSDASAPAELRGPLEAGDCDPWQGELDGRYAATPLPIVAPPRDSTAPLTLGLMDFERLAAAAPVAVAGSGTPMPVEAFGECLEGQPWVWGDPDQPGRPCGGHMPMRYADGDLDVLGGAGQGLLVVAGDLTLTSGARFYGLVIVRGVLSLAGGASLEGMALARNGLDVDPSASLVGSACWAVRALAASRAALGSFVPVPGARIGPM